MPCSMKDECTREKMRQQDESVINLLTLIVVVRGRVLFHV